MKTKLLLLVLLLSSSLLAQDVINNCGMEGKTKIERIKALNRKKNRYNLPSASDFNKKVTLKAMLAQGDDTNRWKETDAAELTGYVVGVSKGSVETCNCGTKDLQYQDTHIELLLDTKNHDNTRRVIVEVTPRLRMMMKDKGIDWSTQTLKTSIGQKWIKVQGWLFFDGEHANASENTNPGGKNNWRATAWEIHPVTSIEVVPPPK
jgi:hypothetical protein